MMEINVKVCQRCGVKKKTDQGVYCQPCGVHIALVKRHMENPLLKHHAKEGSSKGGIKGGRRQIKVTLPPIGKK
jgi:hypothetical protein